jgi:hypothetical protein
VCWSGAPDCPVCHRTVFDAPGSYRVQLATPGFLQAHSVIIHRTVRCDSGATATSRNGRLQKLKNRGTVRISAQQSQSAESEAHRTVNSVSGAVLDCPVSHEDKVSNGRQLLNSNGCVTWLAYRTVFGGTQTLI